MRHGCSCGAVSGGTSSDNPPDGAIAVGEHSIQLARSLNQRTQLTRLLVWTGLIYIGRGDLERGRELVEESWSLSGAGARADVPVDVHMVVPAHIGIATAHLFAREFDDAIRVARLGLDIADRTGSAISSGSSMCHPAASWWITFARTD